MNSAVEAKLPVSVLGWEDWNGMRSYGKRGKNFFLESKAILTSKLISDCGYTSSTTVLFMDDDAFFQKTENARDLINSLRSDFAGGAVFSSESYCFPPESLDFYTKFKLRGKPQNPAYMCPNTGVFAGPADIIMNFLLEMFAMNDPTIKNVDILADLRTEGDNAEVAHNFENDQVRQPSE